MARGTWRQVLQTVWGGSTAAELLEQDSQMKWDGLSSCLPWMLSTPILVKTWHWVHLREYESVGFFEENFLVLPSFEVGLGVGSLD